MLTVKKAVVQEAGDTGETKRAIEGYVGGKNKLLDEKKKKTLRRSPRLFSKMLIGG